MELGSSQHIITRHIHASPLMDLPSLKSKLLLDVETENHMLSILLVQPLGLHLTSYEEISYRKKKAEITSDKRFLKLKAGHIKTK